MKIFYVGDVMTDYPRASKGFVGDGEKFCGHTAPNTNRENILVGFFNKTYSYGTIETVGAKNI